MAVVGATFAYFTATVTDNRTGDGNNGSTNLTTSKVAGTTTVATISGEAGSFTAENVYPGHKEIAAMQVTVSGSEGDISPVTFNYKVTENTIGSEEATIVLYKSDNQLNIGESDYFECKLKTEEDETEGTKYYETCNSSKESQVSGLTKVGKVEFIPQVSGGSAQTVDLGTDVITLTENSKTVYYYAVVEFENDESSQNDTSAGKTLKGQIEIAGAKASE